MALETDTREPGAENPGQTDRREVMGTPPRQEDPNQEHQGWAQPHTPTVKLRKKSPLFAAFLSVGPGLGQVYVGFYQRGFVHIAVVCATIAAIAGGGPIAVLVPFLVFFCLYNIIDAARLASLYNDVHAGAAAPDLLEKISAPSFGGSIVGGMILVVLGFMIFLNTKFSISLEWLEDWWPVGAILLGIYLIYKGVQERKEKTG